MYYVRKITVRYVGQTSSIDIVSCPDPTHTGEGSVTIERFLGGRSKRRNGKRGNWKLGNGEMRKHVLSNCVSTSLLIETPAHLRS